MFWANPCNVQTTLLQPEITFSSFKFTRNDGLCECLHQLGAVLVLCGQKHFGKRLCRQNVFCKTEEENQYLEKYLC